MSGGGAVTVQRNIFISFFFSQQRIVWHFIISRTKIHWISTLQNWASLPENNKEFFNRTQLFTVSAWLKGNTASLCSLICLQLYKAAGDKRFQLLSLCSTLPLFRIKICFCYYRQIVGLQSTLHQTEGLPLYNLRTSRESQLVWYLVIDPLFVCCVLLTLAIGFSNYMVKTKKQKNQLAFCWQLKQLCYINVHLLFRAFWNWW